MKTKFAFMGFRHGHIHALYDLATKRDDVEVVAGCEEHEETRRTLADTSQIKITHCDYAEMLREVDCDIVAVGDYYEKRGRVLIQALKAGKHVIADKPLCIRLSELEEIERLAKSGGLAVGCMLDFRSIGQFRKLRELVLQGEIGEVHAISFNGQHPLCYGTRASWYFEEGKHGGTLNDIGIHAVDYVPWATGLRFTTINAARSWNAAIKEVPLFADGAQVMLTMENGCGVLGDVSYLAPDSFEYSLPQYWRMTFWGSKGMMEAGERIDGVLLYKNGTQDVQRVPPGESRVGGYLEDFLREIRGETEGVELSTSQVIESARISLRIQEAADKGLCNVRL